MWGMPATYSTLECGIERGGVGQDTRRMGVSALFLFYFLFILLFFFAFRPSSHLNLLIHEN